MDAKDILGIPKSALPASQEKKSRPPKESHGKPDGISREVYTLTGGVAPLMPAVDTSQLKKRVPSEEKITWQWLCFTNSARTDNLELYHWVRVVNGAPPTGDYPFAKYNKSVDIVKYSDEEYENYLTDPKWTREETDTLFELCERFDLRFTVIADKFLSSKTMEELKDRYYSVSRAILIARAPSLADVSGYPLVKESYNAAQETERKCALSLYLSHTRYQERKNVEVLGDAKRIMESRLLTRGAEELDSRQVSDAGGEHVDHAHLPYDEGSPSTAGAAIAAVENTTLCRLHVYLRTSALEQMVKAANSTAGLRTIKRVEEALQNLGVNLKPKVPTEAVCAEHLELRKEILTVLNLQKQLQYISSADGSSYRDGLYVDTPGMPKRSHRAGDHDGLFIPDTLSFEGDIVGKRDSKRKGPGRPPVAPSSPASKRARKMKMDG